VIQAIGGGPVDLFATSGGAVNSLALVARHPEDVRILVAHEPALGEVLSDRDTALAAAEGIQKAYRSSGFGPAMAKFIALVTHKGEVPAGFADGPGPDPAMFGLPTEDDGTRNDPLVGQNIVSSTHYKPDFDAIRASATRIVVAVGAESEGEMAHRGGVGVAERLGTTPVTFPSGHGGFLGGEYGQTGEPEAFAKALREALETGN
jgi:pimeloyl-ACP methyl ester carboxylesterase